jgi:hypothetical protein
MKRFNVTILLPNGETMSYVRYGETVTDITDMETRRNPSARSITVESLS